MRKIKNITWRLPMPPCDFCVMKKARPVRQGVYDGPTLHGPWANMCHTHMLDHTPKNSTLISKRVPT